MSRGRSSGSKEEAKAQEAQIEPVPLTIEEDLSQNDRPEPLRLRGDLPLLLFM